MHGLYLDKSVNFFRDLYSYRDRVIRGESIDIQERFSKKHAIQ